MANSVTIFKPYPFEIAQKIRIESGPRKGDWEVINLDDKKVALRCPISGIEVKWDRFCYWSEERENEQWPLVD